MPALSVSFDGNHIATVCTDGYDVLSVRISGTRIDKNLAELEVAGGTFPEDGESNYLTWVDALPVQHGQSIAISFLESAKSSHPGKTIEELFPDEKLPEKCDFKPMSEIVNGLRSVPTLRDGFSFCLASSKGSKFVGKTMAKDHGFGFSIVWNAWHPERARVSLHSYTLDSLETRGLMNDHYKELIHYGEEIRFELVT